MRMNRLWVLVCLAVAAAGGLSGRIGGDLGSLAALTHTSITGHWSGTYTFQSTTQQTTATLVDDPSSSTLTRTPVFHEPAGDVTGSASGSRLGERTNGTATFTSGASCPGSFTSQVPTQPPASSQTCAGKIASTAGPITTTTAGALWDPTAIVATVDGSRVTAGDLFAWALESNCEPTVKALVDAAIVALEAKAEGVTPTASELDAAVNAIVDKVAPGHSLEEVLRVGGYSLTALRQQAFVTVAGAAVWRVDHPPRPESERGCRFIIDLSGHDRLAKSDVRRRGGEPAPAAGNVAEVFAKDGTVVARITEQDALAHVAGLLRPAWLTQLLDDLIDVRLVDRALTRAGELVARGEVDAWERSQLARYAPPFDWRTVCRARGTTVERERERWRRVQAWKRVTGSQPTHAALDAFRDANRDYFTFKTVEVSHILLSTRDDLTGLDQNAAAIASAGERARQIATHARDHDDFEALVEQFSDDLKTRASKGRIAGALKARGASVDPAFTRAAFALKPGEISDPVKCADGWHIIRCDKISEPHEPDWNSDAEVQLIRDECDTDQMNAWLAGLRIAARVVRAPLAELMALKKRVAIGG